MSGSGPGPDQPSTSAALSDRSPRVCRISRKGTGNTSSRPSGVAGELLLDAGALVSLLDRSQTHHTAYRRVFDEWTGAVVSTEAVLTEATPLLAGVAGG